MTGKSVGVVTKIVTHTVSVCHHDGLSGSFSNSNTRKFVLQDSEQRVYTQGKEQHAHRRCLPNRAVNRDRPFYVTVDLDRGYGILIQALDTFYKTFSKIIAPQNGKEILVRDSIKDLLKV